VLEGAKLLGWEMDVPVAMFGVSSIEPPGSAATEVVN
jgi:hypothetical protein